MKSWNNEKPNGFVFSDKHDKDKAEKERQKQIEKENADRLAREAAEAAKAAAQSGEGGEDLETMDGSADKDEDLIGVPHLMVDVADRTKPSSIKIFDMGRLPTVEEVYYMYY